MLRPEFHTLNPLALPAEEVHTSEKPFGAFRLRFLSAENNSDFNYVRRTEKPASESPRGGAPHVEMRARIAQGTLRAN